MDSKSELIPVLMCVADNGGYPNLIVGQSIFNRITKPTSGGDEKSKSLLDRLHLTFSVHYSG